MIVTKAVIEFNTHTAIVSVDDSAQITIFKYNTEYRCCDLESFSGDEQYEASDYILTPPLPIRFQVRIFGDE